MKYKPAKDQKVIGVRDLSRNLSYYLDSLDAPVVVEKYGKVAAILVPPGQFPLQSPKKTKKKMKLSDSPFFKDFKEPTEWKGKSALQIANKLREKASKRWED